LIRHHGRANLLARLGHEAEDGIDALQSQALGYEQSAVPSLTGFLTWLQTEDVTVKRQMDSAGDRIRVMTVHGAKGLEAPIVILPDTGKRDRKLRGELMKSDNKVFWKPKANVIPEPLRDVQEDRDILPDVPALPTSRSPSDLGGAKVMPGETHTDSSDLALAWGRIVHVLLEVLPEADPALWESTAAALVKNHSDAGLIEDHDDLISEAVTLLKTPALSWVFEKGLSEAPISATLSTLNGERIYGIIDRLIVSDEDVIAIDYKSNRITPETPDDTPDGVVRQMAAYRDALREVYPNRNIRTLLLWTRTRKLTEVSDSALDDALKDVTTA